MADAPPPPTFHAFIYDGEEIGTWMEPGAELGTAPVEAEAWRTALVDGRSPEVRRPEPIPRDAGRTQHYDFENRTSDQLLDEL